MRRPIAAAVLGWTLAWGVGVACAPAQGPGLIPSAPAVREVGPPLRLERQSDGRLERVPGLTLETLEQLWRQQKGLEARATPRISVESLAMTARPEGEKRAALDATLTLRTQGEGWLRLPLRLPEVIWLEQPKPETADAFLERADSGETICWLRPRAGRERHELHLAGMAAVRSQLERRHLRLTLPRSAVSRVVLELDAAPLDVRLTAGVGVVANQRDGSRTRAVVDGGDGPLEVVWEPPSAAEIASAREATGAIRVDVGSAGIRWEARLALRSHGGPLGAVRIELPEGARLVPREIADCQVTEEHGAQSPATITVVPRSTEREQLDVLLVAERAGPSPDERVELAGFRVVDAVRQSGKLSVHGDASFTPRWGERHACRASEQPTEGAAPEAWQSEFEYDAQPFRLPLSLAPRTRRVVVEPRYELSVEANRLVCIGRWRYRVEGGKVNALEFDAGEWTLDRWGPAELLVDRAPSPIGGALALPQPRGGTFEVVWRAVAPCPAAEGPIAVRLPRPLGAKTTTCLLDVVPAENCTVLPPSASDVAWTLREGASAAAQQPWQVELLEIDRPLAFQRIVHEGELRASGEARVRVDPRQLDIEQVLRVTARHVRRSAVALRIPRAWLEAGEPEVVCAGIKLPLAVDRHGEPSTYDAWVVLPEPKLGVLELRLRIALPARLEESRTVIPLATTADALWETQRLTVECPSGWNAAPVGGAWRSDDEAWETAGRLDAVELQLARDDRPSAIVERAWIQTRWSGGQQHTRAVYRLASARESFHVTFAAPPSGLLAWVDGQAATPREVAPGRHALALGASAASGHVVELAYSTPDAAAWTKALAPQLDADVVTRRMYWHLPNARATRLGAAPEGFLDELTWTFTAWGFERRSPCDATVLERWSGARSEALPAGEDTGYLFSASQYRASLEPNSWARSRHILTASAASLTIGLLLIFLPAWRHAIVASAALAIALGLASSPAVTLEWLQAGLLGIVLATIAAILERRQALRGFAPPPARGSSVARPDSSTRIRTLPPVVGDALRETTEPSSESRR